MTTEDFSRLVAHTRQDLTNRQLAITGHTAFPGLRSFDLILGDLPLIKNPQELLDGLFKSDFRLAHQPAYDSEEWWNKQFKSHSAKILLVELGSDEGGDEERWQGSEHAGDTPACGE